MELFKELLSDCEDIIEYTSNSKTFSGEFSNQFMFSELNERCLDVIYKQKKVIPRQDFFPSINNLEKTCKECWRFYLNPRNKSIKGLDIQLAKKFEIKLLDFLKKKGINCKRGDVGKKIYPDNMVLDNDEKRNNYNVCIFF